MRATGFLPMNGPVTFQKLDFARAGLQIKTIEDELVALGFCAFRILQERRLLFATDDDAQLLSRYDEERAAEILSAVRDSGSSMGAGDGYASPYLNGLRVAAGQGKGVLPTERLLHVFKANGTFAQERASLIAERARAAFKSEALGRFSGQFFSSQADVVEYLSGYVAANTGSFVKSRKLVDGKFIASFALTESTCMALGLSAKPSVREGHAILLWVPWVLELPAAKVLGKRFHELESVGKPVDVRSAIDGFRIYDVSESSAELTHAFSAYVTATRIVVEHATQG